jgi:uncharacterized membrane protein YcaP (DUF421 family)
MKTLPRAPNLRRSIGAPGRLVAKIAVMLVLPALGAAGVLGGEALDRTLRVVVVFVTLLAIFRLIGKRELGRLSPFELVTLMLIPEVLSNAVQSEGSLVDALAGLSTLFLLVLVTSVLAHRFEKVEHVVEPRPTVLVADGKLIERALNEERILPEELYSEMRKQGIARAEDVRWAVLESSGNVTFVPRELRPMQGQEDDAVA